MIMIHACTYLHRDLKIQMNDMCILSLEFWLGGEGNLQKMMTLGGGGGGGRASTGEYPP